MAQATAIFTQSAPGKRQKTAAERKAEKARKQAELEDVDPDQPWALEVVLISPAQPTHLGHASWVSMSGASTPVTLQKVSRLFARVEEASSLYVAL